MATTTKKVPDSTPFMYVRSVDSDDAPLTDSAGNPLSYVYHSDAFAHERNAGTSNQFGVGVDECEYHSWATATNDEQVSADPCLIFGVLVTADVTGTINIEDGSDDTGTVILTVPTGATTGTFWDMKGAKTDLGIFIDDDSTVGSLIIFWRRQL